MHGRRPRRTPKAQGELALKPGRGGFRPGAGRKPRDPRRPSQPHRPPVSLRAHARARHDPRRSRRLLPPHARDVPRDPLGDAHRRAPRRHFRIIHVSIQRTHVHLVVEAHDRLAPRPRHAGLPDLRRSPPQPRARDAPPRHRLPRPLPRAHPPHARPRSATPSRTSSSTGAATATISTLRRSLDPYSTAIGFADWRELADSPVLYRAPPRTSRSSSGSRARGCSGTRSTGAAPERVRRAGGAQLERAADDHSPNTRRDAHARILHPLAVRRR